MDNSDKIPSKGKSNANSVTYTDWLKLETAVEVIGDMIAYYHGDLCKAEVAIEKDHKRIEELRQKVRELFRERNLCYVEGKQNAVIEKAYTVYGPFLKQHYAAKKSGSN